MAELRIHDQSSIYFKSIRTGHTPKDINVKTPDRSGTLITDTTLRDILNSGANISNTQILKPDIRETPLEHPEAYAKLLPIATYRTNDTFVGEHQATEWVASLNEDFSTILDSTGDPIYRDGWYPAIDTASTKIYVKYRFISNDVASPYSDSLEFTTPEGFVAIPSLSVIEDGATPLLKGSPFKLVGNLTGVNHTASSWSIIRESDNKVIKTLTMDTTKLTEWKVETGLLEPNTAYKVTLVYHTDHPVFSKTRIAIGTYKTPASAIETPTLTFSSADGKFVVNGTTFNVISGTDEHVFTSWIVRNSTSALVFSEPKSKELTSINLTGVLEPDNGYTIECTYKGSKSISNTARLEFRTPSNANINLTKEITLKMLENGDLELTMAPFTQPVQENMLYLTWTLQDFNKKQAVEVRLDKDLDDKYGKELKYTIPASSVKRYLGAATTVDEDGSKYIEFSAKGRVVGEKSIANYSTILPLKVKLTIEKVGNWEVVDSTDMRVPELKAPLASVNGTNYANRTSAIESGFSYGTYWTKTESDMSRLKQASLSTFNILDNDAYAIWDIYQGYNNSGKVVYGQEPSFRYVYSGLRPDGTNSRIDTFKLPARLEDNTEYKVRVTYAYKDFGVYSIPETFTFNTSDIYYKVTSLNVDTSSGKPVATIERNNNQAGMTFGNTSWYLYEQNGTKVWSSENNSANTTSITIDYASFDPDKQYRVGAIVYGPDGVKHSPERQSDLFKVASEEILYVYEDLDNRFTYGTNVTYGLKFELRRNNQKVQINDISDYITQIESKNPNFKMKAVYFPKVEFKAKGHNKPLLIGVTRDNVSEADRERIGNKIPEGKLEKLATDTWTIKKQNYTDTIWMFLQPEYSVGEWANDRNLTPPYMTLPSEFDIDYIITTKPNVKLKKIMKSGSTTDLTSGSQTTYKFNRRYRTELYPLTHFKGYKRYSTNFINYVENLKYLYGNHSFNFVKYLRHYVGDPAEATNISDYIPKPYTGHNHLVYIGSVNGDKLNRLNYQVNKTARTNFDRVTALFKSNSHDAHIYFSANGIGGYRIFTDYLDYTKAVSGNYLADIVDTLELFKDDPNDDPRRQSFITTGAKKGAEVRVWTKGSKTKTLETYSPASWLYKSPGDVYDGISYPFNPEPALASVLGYVYLGEPAPAGTFLFNGNVGITYTKATDEHLSDKRYLMHDVVDNLLAPSSMIPSRLEINATNMRQLYDANRKLKLDMKYVLMYKMLKRGILLQNSFSVYSVMSFADLEDYVTIGDELATRGVADISSTTTRYGGFEEDTSSIDVVRKVYCVSRVNGNPVLTENKAGGFGLGISELSILNPRRTLLPSNTKINHLGNYNSGFRTTWTYAMGDGSEISNNIATPLGLEAGSNYETVYNAMASSDFEDNSVLRRMVAMLKFEPIVPEAFNIIDATIRDTGGVINSDFTDLQAEGRDLAIIGDRGYGRYASEGGSVSDERNSGGRGGDDGTENIYNSVLAMNRADTTGSASHPYHIEIDLAVMGGYINTVKDKGFFNQAILPDLTSKGITSGYNTIDKWHVYAWHGFMLFLPNKKLFTVNSGTGITDYINKVRTGEAILTMDYTFQQPDANGGVNIVKNLKPILLIDNGDGYFGETMLDMVRRTRFIENDKFQGFGGELSYRMTKADAESLYGEIVTSLSGRLRLNKNSELGYDYLDWNDASAPAGWYLAFISLPDAPYTYGVNVKDYNETAEVSDSLWKKDPESAGFNAEMYVHTDSL